MRYHVAHIATAIAIAAAAVACSGRTNAVDNERPAQGGRASGPAEQFVKVDGCMRPGPSANGEYILGNVVLPPAATQPDGQEIAQRPPIVNGTWLRLVGSKDANLDSYLGKRVEVMGRIEDSGENTLGTSGHAGTDQQKFARSSRDSGTDPTRNMPPTAAAPNGADANGDAPRLAVEKVSTLADSCEGQ